MVARVVGDVLGTGPAELSANFFELGGDSLAALDVTGRLIEELDREVPLQALFDAADLAAYSAAVAVAPPAGD